MNVYMTKIRLIASDLDGTLLRNGAQRLRPDTCDLIRALSEKGILFMAASGRQYDNLERLFAPVREKIVYLCQNGASACMQDQLLFVRTMKKETADLLVDEIAETPDTELMVNDWQCCYVREDNEAFYHIVNDVVGMRTLPVPDLHAYTGRCSKISLYQEAGLHGIEYWQEKYGRDFTVVTGGAQWLDMMGKDVNKGTAMKEILRILSIPKEEILVLGDNLNDLEMMALAGLCATVPDGVKEVREAVDTVVNTVEDMMKEILLGKDEIEDWKGKGDKACGFM